MYKKISSIILLTLFICTNILATNNKEYNISLDSVIKPELYTLTLIYEDEEYNSESINATFKDSFTSNLFTVELSDGNEISDLQFIINIIPGNFIKLVENEADYYDTGFKPTPSIDNTFEISKSTYNENTKKLSITSSIIPLGKHDLSQPLAKFYLGWSINEDLPKVSSGTYVSTTIVEYKSESVTE